MFIHSYCTSVQTHQRMDQAHADIWSAIQFCCRPLLPRFLAVVGGGGKTHLCRQAAQTVAALGQRSCFGTSTKMLPEQGFTLVQDKTDLSQVLACASFPFQFGQLIQTSEGEKLTAVTSNCLAEIVRQTDVVFCEADGAKRKPIKACQMQEPVYPPQTDAVAVVVGLSCLGRSVESCCHRWQIAVEQLGVSKTAIMNPERLAQLIMGNWIKPRSKSAMPWTIPPQSAQRFVVLNQADTPQLREMARAVAAALPAELPVLITRLNG